MRIRSSTVLAIAVGLWGLSGCSDPGSGLDSGPGDGSSPSIDGGGRDGEVAITCGDGVVQRAEGEACDDGNTVDGDGCSADCTSDETCGNGTVDAPVGELCDDSNTESGDDCRADCLSDYRCGNGVTDTVADGASTDEVCDDGNSVNGDGCSAACDSDESCGNGVVDLGAGEICDDGNTADGDDCSADCSTSLLCGNGALDGTEECDDGNPDVGDGCNDSCQIERCGNGRLDAAEICDDGNAEENDGCGTDCTFTCSADADCADGDVCNGAETCTDPGTATSSCVAASTPAAEGTACGTGQICLLGGCVTTACGDGFADVAAGEQCEDGNTTAGDGCEPDCTFTCSADTDCADANVCNGTETCTSPGTLASRCGAGTMAPNGTSCGGGLFCNMGACAAAGCGDGIRTGAEQCDDGNTTNGDGCDSDCAWTCTAATAAADCGDGNACNGAEVCTSGGTLASRCGAGTPPAAGTTCGGTNICVGGACVAARCGDTFRSGSELCDDGNTTNGDGCDNDCAWTCTTATVVADCGDANVCNGAEVCTGSGTLASRCGAGTPATTGTVCDRDMSAATRDICRTSMCIASTCGDGYVDAGATPAEQCDDGNTSNGDGCSSTCQTEMAMPPTGFRIVDLDLVSPRITADIPLGGCQDITVNCARAGIFGCQADGVNTQIQTALTTDYSLHIVSLFRPYSPASPTSPVDIDFNAACLQSPTPDSCGPDVMPDVVMTTATNTSMGTCFTPLASEVNSSAGTTTAYAPAPNTVSGPCFITSPQPISVVLSGIVIPLRDARFSATYSGTTVGGRRLVSGMVRGFLTETDAATILLPNTIPAPLGNTPLYTHLQAGNLPALNSSGASVADGCNVGGGGNENDADMNGTTRGFWFFLNFTAEEITWTGP